jgi:hypothetical protein
MGLSAHTRIDGETAVFVGQHFFGLETLQEPTTHEGAQNAAAQSGLDLECGVHINASGRVEDDARLGSLKRWMK